MVPIRGWRVFRPSDVGPASFESLYNVGMGTVLSDWYLGGRPPWESEAAEATAEAEAILDVVVGGGVDSKPPPVTSKSKTVK